tara:strand:+ start:292 stop:1188 length:897 start_codon:yes stop_codon:yes gene_type:complete
LKLPIGVDIDNLISDLINLSWEASEILIYYSKKLKDKNYKKKIIEKTNIKDPVTVADLQVNELIFKRINEKYPNVDWEFLSEEDAKLSNAVCGKESDWLWILDPLDGTRDFIQGTGNYAMHLSLNFKDRPYIGFVLIPEREELWLSNSFETICLKKDGSQLSPCRLDKKDLGEIILVSSKNHRNLVLKNLIEKINFKDTKIMGSIGCKIASLIKGESDVYISLSLPGQSSPKDWDFAAPEAILISSGGSITNINNESLIYNQPGFRQSGLIIASNNSVDHRKLCSEIRQLMLKNKITI